MMNIIKNESFFKNDIKTLKFKNFILKYFIFKILYLIFRSICGYDNKILTVSMSLLFTAVVKAVE